MSTPVPADSESATDDTKCLDVQFGDVKIKRCYCVGHLVLLQGTGHAGENTACNFERPSLQIQYSMVVMPTMQCLMKHCRRSPGQQPPNLSCKAHGQAHHRFATYSASQCTANLPTRSKCQIEATDPESDLKMTSSGPWDQKASVMGTKKSAEDPND